MLLLDSAIYKVSNKLLTFDLNDNLSPNLIVNPKSTRPYAGNSRAPALPGSVKAESVIE